MNIITMIKELKQMGLTDDYISAKTGLSQSTITRLKNGACGGQLKSINKIEKIHRQLTGNTQKGETK